MKIGSHVGMSGKEMLLGSAKEAVSYGADTFMFYTGAPQNTRRKEIEELNIDPAWEYMKEHGIQEIIVHAPYIINLGNAVKPETFSLAVEFLAKEIDRTVSLQKPYVDSASGSPCRRRSQHRNRADHKRAKRSSYAGYGLLCGVRNNGGERIGDRSYV